MKISIWKIRCLIAIVLFFSLGPTAYGLWDPKKIPVKSLKDVTKYIGIHPFNGHQVDVHKSFNLFQSGLLSFDEAIRTVIVESLDNPFVKIESKNEILPGPYSLTGAELESNTYHFSVNDIPVCGYEIAAHKLWNGASLVIGSVPVMDVYEPQNADDWPDIYQTVDTLQLYFQDEELGTIEKIMKKTRCFLLNNTELIPVWNLTVFDGDLSYQALVDPHQVHHFENMFFHVQGKARVYKKNPVDGIFQEYNIEVKEDGTLENSFFVSNPVKRDKAVSSDFRYFYDPSDPKFAETSAFVHAAIIFEYFRGLGYKWQNDKSMELKVHATPNQSVNNALYQPGQSTTTGNPTISIGDGDGVLLQNLAHDSDVVHHEFGHHIIYRKLTSISNESLILHEGMADFFAFAQSGDDCLGESICPVNSLACWAQGQCLRTANNTITFGSDMYNKLEPHLKGQVISGFLWDMRKGSEIPAEAVDAMVYRSIDFFVSNSGIRDLILGLMLADKEKFDGQYSCKVINYANARGFGSLTSDIDCNDSNQWTNLIGVKVPGSGDNSSRTSQKKKESHSSCGTISSPDETQPFFVVFLLLFGPVLLVLFSALFRKNNKSV